MSCTGIDLVHIPKFAEKIRDETLLKRLFTEQELAYAHGSHESFAGMFAAKEAYFKAIRKMPDWHAVEVGHEESGAPVIHADPRAQVSISHDGDYAVAVVIVEN